MSRTKNITSYNCVPLHVLQNKTPIQWEHHMCLEDCGGGEYISIHFHAEDRRSNQNNQFVNMHSSFMKTITKCRSYKELAGVFHDKWTVFHFSEINFEIATHLLHCRHDQRCIASFSSRESEWKATKWKKKRRIVCTAVMRKDFLWDATTKHLLKINQRTKDANASSPNTLRKSWLSELPALLLARHVYGPPSPCRMFLMVSVLLPPSSVLSTYCSDRSITWPFLWTQTIRWDDWLQLRTHLSSS